MYIRKSILCVVTAVLLSSFTEKIEPAVVAAPAAEAARAEVLTNRLEQIKAMDKSEMGFSEKKKLRQEVRAIKKNLRELSGGVFLSVGAIIIIVLLLILLL